MRAPRTTAAVLVLVFAITSPAAAGAGRFIRGDADGDGSASITDAVSSLGHLFGGRPVSCAAAADANDSGDLDLTDPIFVLNHLFLGGEAPPAPFPECGSDPTPDGLSCDGFDSCAGPPPPRCETTVRGELTPGDYSVEDVRAELHVYRGLEHGEARIDMTSDEVDSRLFVVAVREDGTKEVTGADRELGGDGDASVTFAVEPDVLYAVFPVGGPGETGSFSLCTSSEIEYLGEIMNEDTSRDQDPISFAGTWIGQWQRDDNRTQFGGLVLQIEPDGTVSEALLEVDGQFIRGHGRITRTRTLLLSFELGPDDLDFTGPVSISSEGHLAATLEVALNGRNLFRINVSLALSEAGSGTGPGDPREVLQQITEVLTRSGGTGYWYQPGWIPGAEILGGLPVQGTDALFVFRLDRHFPGFGGTGHRQRYLPIGGGQIANTTPTSFRWELGTVQAQDGSPLYVIQLTYTGEMSTELIWLRVYENGVWAVQSNNAITGQNGHGIWYGCGTAGAPEAVQFLCSQP